MSDDPHERQAWTDGELDLIVSDYFLMLTEETAGAPFNKAEHNRTLRNEIVRSKSSIEFKHRNISAVLQQLGLPRIKGYFPAENFNTVERDFRNRKLGRDGEELVFQFERERLRQLDRSDLASKIRWISEEDGDGAGYDILSFDAKGKERLIEVKTTVGSEITPFYITRNELSLSSERPDAFRLCRVFEFSSQPRMFELVPPLEKHVHLSPLSYEASFS